MSLALEGGLPTVRLNRFVLASVVLVVLAGVVTGLLTGGLSWLARTALYATGLRSSEGPSTLPPGAFSHPRPPKTPEPQPPGEPPAVLVPAQPGPPPKARAVDALVDGVDRTQMKGSFSGSVIDGGSGRVLYAENARKGYIPASTMKLLTTTAAVSILGPQHRFTTKVVSQGPGRIILVGGGDPYLVPAPAKSDPGRASLARLAQLTASQLKKNKRTSVTLGYDVSLFSGPAWHPDWPPTYHDQVTPVSALWVNEGHVYGSPGPRVANPPSVAANAFATALKAHGVRVSGVTKVTARKGDPQVAAVASLPLERIIEHLLMVSDNDAAEVLSRQAAIGAGEQGSFAAGRQVVRQRLSKLGVWDGATLIRDGSGLSRKNRVPSDVMVKVLRLDLEDAHPELRAVVSGLPVAGVEGSLRVRFSEKGSTAARGLVRGKTGTLTNVHALAGYVRSHDGSLLVYAFLVNNPKNALAARVWLDRVSSALSTCGCR
jgi:D-alanyl-D-alanine carboxypeptidase/D-alanyl-D-alanine-endopeptidase (penicillin-binding protein 4)